MTVGSYIKQLGDGSTDGTVLGASAASLIAFHGATPSAQVAVTTTISVSVPVSTTGGVFGFSTSAQAIALTAAVNAILDALKAKGLMASA